MSDSTEAVVTDISIILVIDQKKYKQIKPKSIKEVPVSGTKLDPTQTSGMYLISKGRN